MREPFQVLIIPYRFFESGLEVLVGKRSDGGYWQLISGGGESGEALQQAAIRELEEETGLIGRGWVKLDAMCMLPKIYYQGHEHWNNNIYVIPEHCFMVQVQGSPKISTEHSELKWLQATEASSIVKYDSNRIAIWELQQRVKENQK